jgi:hypothetical protein
MAQHLTTGLSQQVIVENRPGAGGTIGAAAAAKSPADGYTLLLASTSNLSISPSLYANPGYDPVTSFAPISLLATAPFLVMVHPSIAREVAERTDRSGEGETWGAELRLRGQRLTLAYRGGDVEDRRGRATGPCSVQRPKCRGHRSPFRTHTGDGRATLSGGTAHPKRKDQASRRRRLRSGIPSFQISPLPPRRDCRDTRSSPGWGLVAPRGAPLDVVRRLNAELVKALQTKEVRDGLFNQGPATGRQLSRGICRIHRERSHQMVARSQDIGSEDRLTSTKR